jgi:hypothetical protein
MIPRQQPIRLECWVSALLTVIACFSPVRGQEPPLPVSKITKLPIQLEKLTEQQRAHIRQLHELDDSSYLVDTRPVLFQIQGVKDSEDQWRGPVTFDRPVTVMIYCLGEAHDGRLVDYGWITDASTDKVVWKMQLEKTEQGGTAANIRKQVGKLELPAGTYTLRYHSNESNSSAGWTGGSVEREFYYGITVFNLEAIAKIRDEFVQAKMPLAD